MDNWQELAQQLKAILPDETDQRILLALKQNDYDIERAAEALMTGAIKEEERVKDETRNQDRNKLNPRQNGRSRTPERKKSDPPKQRQTSPRKTGGWAGISNTEPDPSKALPQYQKRVDPLYFKKGDFPQLAPTTNNKPNEGNATVDFLQQIFGTRVSRDALIARLNGHQGEASSTLESLLAEEGGADDDENSNNNEENEPLFDKSIIEQQKKMNSEAQSSRKYEPSRAAAKRHPTVPPPSGRLAKAVMMTPEQLKSLVLENTNAQDIYREARREAVKRFKSYNNACRQATKAYERGSHSEARDCTQKARELRAQAVDLHDEAAMKIYATNNHHREKNEVDLHGLHAEEALMVLAIKLQALALEDPPTVKDLRVITGIGVHQTGRAIIGPAVEHFLIEHKCKYTTPRPGMVLVTVKYIEVAF